MGISHPSVLPCTEFLRLLEDLNIKLSKTEFGLPENLYLHDSQLQATQIPPNEQPPYIEIRRFEGKPVAVKTFRRMDHLHIFKDDRNVHSSYTNAEATLT